MPLNKALLLIEIPLADVVLALERQYFWLFCLLPLGLLDILFLSLVGRHYFDLVLAIRLTVMCALTTESALHSTTSAVFYVGSVCAFSFYFGLGATSN